MEKWWKCSIHKYISSCCQAKNSVIFGLDLILFHLFYRATGNILRNILHCFGRSLYHLLARTLFNAQWHRTQMEIGRVQNRYNFDWTVFILKRKLKIKKKLKIIGSNPGLGFRPLSNNLNHGSLIWYNSTDKDQVSHWGHLLDDFLERKYYSISISYLIEILIRFDFFAHTQLT